MRLALYQPDIAQNTGTMLRLCACLDVGVDLIGPAGFDMSDRAFRRAGLDYLPHVSIRRHVAWADFAAEHGASGERLVLLTTAAEIGLYQFTFRAGDTLLLGRETSGVPEHVHHAAHARIRIPMRQGLRSLNVAVASAIALGEALRQTGQHCDSRDF